MSQKWYSTIKVQKDNRTEAPENTNHVFNLSTLCYFWGPCHRPKKFKNDTLAL